MLTPLATSAHECYGNGRLTAIIELQIAVRLPLQRQAMWIRSDYIIPTALKIDAPIAPPLGSKILASPYSDFLSVIDADHTIVIREISVM